MSIQSIIFIITFFLSATSAFAAAPAGVSCVNNGINTPFGCLEMGTDGLPAITILLRWGTSIGGGIAILMIAYAALLMSSASGDPKRLKAGQEMLISALAGLLLITISVTLLNFLGFNLLHLPGF